MEQKRALTGILTSKYRGSRSRKDRSRILDEIDQGQTVELVVGRKSKRRVTKRARTCDEAVKREIVFLWACFDQMCGKRLVAMLPDILPVLVQRGRISRGQEVHQKLFHISAATVDRMLKNERAKRRLKGNTHTRPSSILKSQIPIIISSELNVREPGHHQIDLVGHDGGNPNGHIAFTLNGCRAVLRLDGAFGSCWIILKFPRTSRSSSAVKNARSILSCRRQRSPRSRSNFSSWSDERI